MDTFSHSYGESTYHFWWITKYRYKILRKSWHKYLCRDILNQIAKMNKITIHSLGMGDDHINMVATIPPTMSINKVIQLLKGASAYVFFRVIPNLRKRYPKGHLWGIGYGFRSVGDVDTDTVVAYVNRHNQTELTQFM